jgi:molecular chaperone GrpE
MFSIDEQLRRLQPINLSEATDSPVPASAFRQWDELTKTLARVGKQQMRANQNVEEALRQSAATLALSEQGLATLREQFDDQRRELQRLRDHARDTRLSVLGTIDALDDLMAMARQKHDALWIERVERLIERTLDTLAQIGLTEIPAFERPFDEHVHEAVDAVARGDRDPYVVVEVIRRGFRYEGTVLRRAQVVATR